MHWKKSHTYKSEPIFKDWETKKPRWEHQDKGEAAGEEDHPGRAHHLQYSKEMICLFLRGFESPCCQGRSSGPGKTLRGPLPASILQTRPAEAPKHTHQTFRLTLAKTTSPPPRSCRDSVSYVWCRQSLLLEHSVEMESFNADSVPFEPFPWLISIPKRVSGLAKIFW